MTIGEDGFAFERNADGELERFPHRRGVKIGDNVEVGANTNIARGSLCDTIIGNGTKIADMVHIGHNILIGKHCQIADRNGYRREYQNWGYVLDRTEFNLKKGTCWK